MATVPDLIPVQGVLADAAGTPVDDLTDLTFTLYDDEAGTTDLWTDTFTDVDVVEGFFTVYLGSNATLDFASLISNSEVWMGITVETDPRWIGSSWRRCRSPSRRRCATRSGH